MKVEIVDVILHRNERFTQTFVVLNRKPEFFYERNGKWLMGEDSGLFSFYFYERPTKMFQAFAGRKFEIQLTNGEIIQADGQWWYGVPADWRDLLYSCGTNTAKGLASCYVFCSSEIDRDIFDTWINNNSPSNNYNKYNPNHADFRKHKIISRWDSPTPERRAE